MSKFFQDEVFRGFSGKQNVTVEEIYQQTKIPKKIIRYTLRQGIKKGWCRLTGKKGNANTYTAKIDLDIFSHVVNLNFVSRGYATAAAMCVLSHLPTDVKKFVKEKCLLIGGQKDRSIKVESLSKNITHLIIFPGGYDWEIAEQIAHAWLGHPSVTQNRKVLSQQLKVARDLAKKWGFGY